jgi:putative component of membrane protein insertase Oxa1/YidC/SpoIIIJ protein YidD
MNHLNLKFPITIPIIIVILSFHIPSSLGKDNMKGPVKPKSGNQLEIYGSGDNFLLNIYQKWISPVKGGNTCPMYPACSQYAKIAFQVLPWYEAYISSLERMLRCGNDLSIYPVILINGQTHWYDPIIIKDLNHDLQINEDDR